LVLLTLAWFSFSLFINYAEEISLIWIVNLFMKVGSQFVPLLWLPAHNLATEVARHVQ